MAYFSNLLEFNEVGDGDPYLWYGDFFKIRAFSGKVSYFIAFKASLSPGAISWRDNVATFSTV